jgi:NAD(P)H-dependent FMN reductase
MKILAFAASNSHTSINRKLVDYSISMIKDDLLPDAEFETRCLSRMLSPIAY